MFSRASKGVIDLVAPKSRVPRNGLPSIVGEGLHIDGDLLSDGDVRVDGRVEGDVQGRTITVGVSGRVAGKIIADEAVISGSVGGGIVARSVVLTGTARVTCSIVQESLVVEAGAVVAGMVERPDLRLPKPTRMNGAPESMLIERVYWTRRTDERWVPLGT